MKELPLAVAISALIKDNQILLIKRLKGDYVGLLGLPGGKAITMTYSLTLLLTLLAEVIFFFLPFPLKRKWKEKFGHIPPEKIKVP